MEDDRRDELRPLLGASYPLLLERLLLRLDLDRLLDRELLKRPSSSACRDLERRDRRDFSSSKSRRLRLPRRSRYRERRATAKARKVATNSTKEMVKKVLARYRENLDSVVVEPSVLWVP